VHFQNFRAYPVTPNSFSVRFGKMLPWSYTPVTSNLFPLYTFLKMLPNGLKLFGNKVDVVATFWGLFTNFMDGLGRDRTGRMLQNVDHVEKLLASIPSCSWTELQRTENEMDVLYTHGIAVHGSYYRTDVLWRGITWPYVCTPTGSVSML